MRSWLFILVLPGVLAGTELAPWFGKSFQIEGRADARYQHYSRVAEDYHPEKWSSDDFILHFSAAVSIFDRWNAEIETSFADTRRRTFAFNDVRLTGRYLVWDDDVGDFASVAIGFTAIFPYKEARKDLSLFYHGGVEGEAHVAVGKSCFCGPRWTSRVWGMAAYGVADLGSPWARGDVHWEWNFCNQHLFDVFVETLWGFGGNNLDLEERFKGYGSLRHQSVDVGGRYAYIFPSYVRLEGEVRRRVHARNFPYNALQVVVGLYYPFGL